MQISGAPLVSPSSLRNLYRCLPPASWLLQSEVVPALDEPVALLVGAGDVHDQLDLGLLRLDDLDEHTLVLVVPLERVKDAARRLARAAARLE